MDALTFTNTDAKTFHLVRYWVARNRGHSIDEASRIADDETARWLAEQQGTEYLAAVGEVA